MNIVDKGTISSGFRNKQITPIDNNKMVEKKSTNDKAQTLNNFQKRYENDNSEIKGLNHLKIIPSSGVIYKISENKKTGDEIYKNKNGRMSYKEYILLRNKHMETDYNNNEKTNRTYINQNEEDKKQIKKKKKDDKKDIRSKSKSDKIRNYDFNNIYQENIEKDLISYQKESQETKKLYETNLDDNGNEVLNENLFKLRKNEYKSMRKTFTGQFYQRKGSQQKDKKRETFYNFNYNYKNKNINNAYNSHYGGFKNNNIVKKK